MTVLKCYATTCVYNKEQLCSKGNIDVMGENAHLSEDTCCGSFRETIQIDCKAHHCSYNDDCKCTAAAIQVSGENAKDCQETKCGTFRCER